MKAVKACAVCSAKFGVTRHKYHCRVRPGTTCTPRCSATHAPRTPSFPATRTPTLQVCGHVICNSCSRTRVHLPTSRSGQAKRVCDTCVPGVRDGLKAGETLKRVEDDEAEHGSEEERKLAAAAIASGAGRGRGREGLLSGASNSGAAAATAAAVAAAAAQGDVQLLTADDEAEIVNDSLAEAGF